jgi:hypothetical protein
VTTITCQDCSQRRSNARFRNTRYCVACRMLRDFLYVGDEQRPCVECARPFAPVHRKDTMCGPCCFGSIHEGRCAFCELEHAELYRPGIAVCVRCVRDPKQRRRILAGLRKGQRERRAANHHEGATS